MPTSPRHQKDEAPHPSPGPWRTYAGVLRHQLELRQGRKEARTAEGPQAVPAVRESVRVDAAGNARFCAAVHADPGENAHLGYLHALTFRPTMRMMSASEFPLPLLGLVHLENRAEAPAPVPCGTDAVLVSRVVEFGQHRRGRTVLVRAEIQDEQGGVLFWDESLYLHKSPSASGGGEKGSASSRPAASPPQEHPRGKEVLVGKWRVEPETGRKYAAASGDLNPIHLSSASARLFGMPSSIAHGMYCAARALGQMTRHPDRGLWEVAFGRPVRLPSTVLVQRVMGPSDLPEVMTLLGRSRKGERYWTVSLRQPTELQARA